MDISRKLLHIARKEPEHYFVMTSDLIMDSDEPLDQQINDYFTEQIRRGIENGEFKNVDPQMTATNIRTALISFVRWICVHKNLTAEQADSYLGNFFSILTSGIKSNDNETMEELK